jgi:putative addiction module killer protein
LTDSATAPPSLGSTSGFVAPLGNPGDVRPAGAGVSELRIDYGPGYRIYFIHRSPETVVLLCGGDKSTQDRDIGRAKELAKEDRDGA